MIRSGPTTFTKNRGRLLNDQVMGSFLEKLMGAPEVKPLQHRCRRLAGPQDRRSSGCPTTIWLSALNLIDI
jgi:hypothetical protein